MIAGCDINFGDGINRPRGWTDETHGPNADANYDVVFAQDVVKRIDLIIKPRDWQAMLDDMTELAGEFGAGEGFGGGSPGSPTCLLYQSFCAWFTSILALKPGALQSRTT